LRLHTHHNHTRYPRTTANMVLAKSKKSVGLGNSLMNDRFGKGKGADMRRGAFQQGIERTGQDGQKVRIPRVISKDSC
jgi:hypothetical protein